MRLEDVTVAAVEDFSAALSQREHHGKPITPRMRKKVLNVLHGIFVRARKVWGRSTNPATEVERHPQRSSGGLGRLRHRPLPLNHRQAELSTTFQTERRVSVQISFGVLLGGTEVLGSSQPPRRPGWTNLLRNYTYARRPGRRQVRSLSSALSGSLVVRREMLFAE